MPKKKPPLSETNPYLKDPKERRFWIRTTVVSSAAIMEKAGASTPTVVTLSKIASVLDVCIADLTHEQ
jgi:hypothetical protein